MKNNRIKLTQPILRSRAEAEATVREICELKTAFALAEAEMNAAVTQAKKQFEERFAPAEKQILEKSALLQAWAENNPSEFHGLKSLDMTHGQIGWRTGQPQLKTLSGWTWDRVLEAIKSFGGAEAYVRLKEEVNKQQLLADREKLTDSGLREIGVRVLQEEAFFIEPNLQQTENRINALAA